VFHGDQHAAKQLMKYRTVLVYNFFYFFKLEGSSLSREKSHRSFLFYQYWGYGSTNARNPDPQRPNTPISMKKTGEKEKFRNFISFGGAGFF
jgi:hypothetical protein